MRALLAATGLCGFIGVAAGAFGAHALKDQFSPEAIGWWETGTFYLLVHTVAAFAAISVPRDPHAKGRCGFTIACFLIGGLIFSGSLYAMALGAPRWLGAVTPLGGLTLLVGWASLVWIGLNSDKGR